MKRMLKRGLALLLALLTLLSLPMSTLQASAISETQLDEYLNTTPEYDPQNGFYGYLSVRMENGSDFDEKSVPVLVKGGHVLVSATEFGRLSKNIALTINITRHQVAFRAFRKTVLVSEKSNRAYFNQGDYNAAYTMSTACLWQDEELWVPMQDVCILLGMDYHDFVDDSITMSAPQKDILDIYLDIMDTAGSGFDFREAYLTGDPEKDAKIEKALEKMGVSAHLVDNLDGMLKLELDKWLDSMAEVLTLGFADTDLTDSAFMKDVIESVLNASPDEASLLNAENTAFAAEVLGLAAGTGEFSAELLGTDAQKMLDIIKAFRNSVAKVDVKNMTYFSSVAEKSQKAGKFCGTAGDLLDASGYLISAYQLIRDINNQDELAKNGMSTILDILQSRGDTVMSKTAFDAARSACSAYSGGTGSATAYWLGDNINSFVSTGAHVAFGTALLPLDIYKLGAGLLPGYSDNLDAMENFRMALVAMALEQDVYGAAMTNIGPGTVLGEGDFAGYNMDSNLEVLYAWLKTRYVARLAGMNAMHELQDTAAYASQKALLRQEAQWLAAIAAYTDAGFNDPSELQAALDTASDSGFCDYVIPAYVRVHGTITDTATGEALNNVKLTLTLNSQKIIIMDTVNGAYEYYLPLKWDSGLQSEIHPNPTANIGKVEIEASHGDYEGSVKNSSEKYTPVSLGSLAIPAQQYELQLDINFGELDYYRYIRDNLLPEFGYAKLGDVTGVVDMSIYQSDGKKTWNYDNGLIGAVIADFDSDEKDECMVLRRENDGIWLEALYIKGGAIQWTRAESPYLTVSNQPHWFNWVGLLEVDGRMYLSVQWKFSYALVTGVGQGYRFLRMREGEIYEAAAVWAKSSGDYYSYTVTVPVSDSESKTITHDQEWVGNSYFARLKEAGFDVGDVNKINMTYVYNSWKDIETLWDTPQLTKAVYAATTGSTSNYSSYNTTTTVTDYTELREHIEALED